MSDTNLPPEIYSEKAAMLRRQRLADLTRLLQASEGQELVSVLRRYSKATGKSMKTINEYWEIISDDNKGPIYEKNGIVKVRTMFRRWIK